MPKPRSGFKKSFNYQPPEGVRIDIKTQEAYEAIRDCAKYFRLTIGQYAERTLKYAMSGVPYIPPPLTFPTRTPTKRPRSFQLPESMYADIEQRVGEDRAKHYIASTPTWCRSDRPDERARRAAGARPIWISSN